MKERLYCPDFSAIFDKKFQNPFNYPMVDSLVFPTMKDVPLSAKGKKLLELKASDGHPLFYRRGLTIDNLLTEMKCSDIKASCIQAIDLTEEYGIDSETVLKYTQKYPNTLFPILSPFPSDEGVKKFREHADKAVAAVIYPSYQHIDLNHPHENITDIIEICKNNHLPLKIDLGNMYLPDNDTSVCTVPMVKRLISMNPEVKFIISGIDLTGNGIEMINLLRYERNASVEFDTRTFGGTTPVEFFKTIFAIPGFPQYEWDKFLLGSATPMLESSQLTRGFWDATETLSFALRSLLRSWMYRNIHRIFNPKLSESLEITSKDNISDASEKGIWDKPLVIQREGGNGIMVSQNLQLQSFSITQLLHIQSYVKNAISTITAKYPDYKYGDFTLKSPHTTVSLIVNEHEFGNYLQLHYDLCTETMKDAKNKLHTVPALENRADFNYPDHITASTHGQRSITAPIIDGKPKLGGRENWYVLVTFGPRTLSLQLTVNLFKGNKI